MLNFKLFTRQRRGCKNRILRFKNGQPYAASLHEIRQGQRTGNRVGGDNLKVVWAKFSSSS